jgi:hypothetical protein
MENCAIVSRGPCWRTEQSFALQQVIGRSLPASQGIVTFFTIFLPFVYCSAAELSTAIEFFRRRVLYL